MPRVLPLYAILQENLNRDAEFRLSDNLVGIIESENKFSFNSSSRMWPLNEAM
jgi:hypothetical protein